MRINYRYWWAILKRSTSRARPATGLVDCLYDHPGPQWEHRQNGAWRRQSGKSWSESSFRCSSSSFLDLRDFAVNLQQFVRLAQGRQGT
jgi:predicted NUDIX family NTP pyrophosphohydrolase